MRNVTDSTDHAIDFLQKHGVIEKSILCPGPLINGYRSSTCNHDMVTKITKDRKDGILWRCRKTHKVLKKEKMYCVKDVKLSIRYNTWLSDAKLPLEIVIELMYLWANGFDQDEIRNELNISNKTLIEWTYYFREAVTLNVMESSEQIGGNGVEVEIDESKFGKRKYYRGHRVEGQWVFGGREKYDKSKVFMIPVENRKQTTLLPIIKKWIKAGSIIHSDCWKAYNCLERNGYTHVTVNHSKEFLNKENYACTNGIESDWRHAKVSIPRYGVKQGLHSFYLGEFMWRRKMQDKDKFLQLINILNEQFKKKLLMSCPK